MCRAIGDNAHGQENQGRCMTYSGGLPAQQSVIAKELEAGLHAGDELRGSFVETALTTDEVQRAIAEEARLGMADIECTFLAGQDQDRDRK